MRDAAAAMGFAKVKRISMVEIEGAYEAGSGGHGRFYLRVEGLYRVKLSM